MQSSGKQASGTVPQAGSFKEETLFMELAFRFTHRQWGKSFIMVVARRVLFVKVWWEGGGAQIETLMSTCHENYNGTEPRSQHLFCGKEDAERRKGHYLSDFELKARQDFKWFLLGLNELGALLIIIRKVEKFYLFIFFFMHTMELTELGDSIHQEAA